jgi:hypothetical protein
VKFCHFLEKRPENYLLKCHSAAPTAESRQLCAF